MKKIKITGSKKLISPLIIGAHCYYKEHSDDDFDQFVTQGGNCIHMHGEGGEVISRTNVSNWMQRRKNRESLSLIFQICHGHEESTDDIEKSRFSKSNVSDDIEENLSLLKTDYLDLVILGGDNEKIPVNEIIDVVENERSKGRMHAYGVFNWKPERIKDAQRYAASINRSGISFINTTELSLGTPLSPIWENYIPFNDSMLELVATENIPVIAWVSDFNQSFFIPDSARVDNIPDDRRQNRWYTEHNFKILSKIRNSEFNSSLNERQVNVNFILNQRFPTAGIFYQDFDPPSIEYFGALNNQISREELENLLA